MPIGVNSGGWKDVTAIGVNVGGSWKAVTAVAVNVGGTWKQVFSSGPTIATASSGILSYGTGTEPFCGDPHYNRVEWTISGTCAGHTVRIYSSNHGEIIGGLSCAVTQYDHAISEITQNGGGSGTSYEVRLYNSSSQLVDSKSAGSVTWQTDYVC